MAEIIKRNGDNMNCPITHEAKRKGKTLAIPCSAKLKWISSYDNENIIESKYRCPKCNKEFMTFTQEGVTTDGPLVDTETGEIFE